MPTGTVKFFNAPKGFGFITSDEGGKDIFLPAASLTAAGLPNPQLGQRVSFEIQPDKKGPKAVTITLIAGAPLPPKAPKAFPAPVQNSAAKNRLTFYFDPESEESAKPLDALQASGLEPHLVDYIGNPPTRDELITLSHLLRVSDQSLMRKYDPLFRELRLDDRFISQNELWDAIVEHPSLINGPILSNGAGARICRSQEDVAAFLEGRSPKIVRADMARKNTPEDEPKAMTDAGATHISAAAVSAPLPAKKEKPPAQASKTEPLPRPVKTKSAPVKAAPKAKPKAAAKAKPDPEAKAKKPVKKTVPRR